VQRHGQRDPGGFAEGAREPSGQHPHPVSAERQCVGDWGVVDHAAVDEIAARDPHRREHRGDRRAGQDRIDRVAAREQDVLAAEHAGGNNMERHRSVFEPTEPEVVGEEPAGRCWVPSDADGRGSRAGRRADGSGTRRRVDSDRHNAPSASMPLASGRPASQPPLTAPTEVPTMRSGATPTSVSAASIPTAQRVRGRRRRQRASLGGRGSGSVIRSGRSRRIASSKD